MKFSIGYITAPTKTEAKEIMMELFEHGLIACANIISGTESYYVWNDELQHENEVIMIIKTHSKNESKIIKAVKKMHSYDCPCIIFVPLTDGNKDYLRWIKDSC